MKKLFQALVMLAGFALAIFCVVRLRALLGVVCAAAVFAYLANRPVQLMQKRIGIKGAVAVAFGVAAVAMGVLIGLVLPLLARQMTELAGRLPEVLNRGRQMLDGVKDLLPMFPAEEIEQRVTQWMTNLAVQLAQRSYDAVGWVAMTPILAFYFLRDKDEFIEKLQYLVPLAWREDMLLLWRGIDRSLRQFIRGQVVVSVAVGVLTALGLALVRVPYAALLGAVMVLCNLIPYIGPVLGALPVAAIALMMGWRTFALAMLVVVGVQQMENMFISPRVIGGSISMHPVYVLLGVLSGGALLGAAGFLLAIPLLIILKETAAFLLKKRLYPH